MITHRWLLFGALLLSRPAAGQVKPELIHLFDYDAKAPLDVKEGTVVDREGVKVHDITYASPKGGRVPGWCSTSRASSADPRQSRALRLAAV